MSVWGSTWGGVTGTPTAVEDLIRSDRAAEVAYLLVIEGIRDMFVTEHGPGGELVGSGADSWIGQYEIAAGLPHTRVVRPGLQLPSNIPTDPAIDLATGMFRTSTIGFRVVDVDGTLPELFAQEGKEAWTMLQGVRAGISDVSVLSTRDLSRPALVPADAEWTSEGACYVSTETLGPNGERRWWPCMPDERYNGFGVTWSGLEHASYLDVSNPLESPVSGPARVLLSFRPLVFEGRRVALYRLYRDPDQPNWYPSWSHWGRQHDAGALVWFGTLRDTGQLSGSHSWTLSCFGKESWLKRQLGTYLHNKWMPIRASRIELSPEQRHVSVEISRYRVGEDVISYRSKSFTSVLAANYSSTGALVAALKTFIEGVHNGATSPDYNSAGFDVTSTSVGLFFEWTSQHVQIRSPASSTATELVVRVALHEDVWTWIGYDLGLQVSILNSNASGDTTSIYGYKIPSGVALSVLAETDADNPYPPSPDYWVLNFSTRSPTEDHVMNNRQQFRNYEPMYPGTNRVVLGPDATGFITEADNPYIPDDPFCPRFDIEIESAVPANAYRYFLFRGRRFSGTSSNGYVIDESGNVLEDVEAEPYYQFGIVGWRSTSFGQVDNDSVGLYPGFRVCQWLDPRTIGYDFRRLTGSSNWVGLASGDARIEMLPLNSYVYNWDPDDWEGGSEPAWVLFVATLLSTGTGTRTGFVPNVAYTAGVNTNGNPFAASAAADDRLAADMGLGIPNELVGRILDVAEEFTNPYAEPNQGMNRGRWVYGPEGFESYKFIESLIRSRGLHLSMSGGRFGVKRWGIRPDAATMTLTEDDIAGNVGSPGSTRPTQKLRATPQIDAISVAERSLVDSVADEYRYTSTLFQRARDAGSNLRSGDKVFNLEDHGRISSTNRDLQLRNLWAVDLAEFFGRRHFMVEGLKINRIKGQDLHSGDTVRLTNPWVIDTAGSIGINGALGLVTGVDLNTKNETYTVSVLVYAGQSEEGPYVYAPLGRIVDISGADIELEPDHFGTGETRLDAEGFTTPAWMTGTNVRVGIVTFDRKTWRLHPAQGTVQSVAGNVVTLSAPLGTDPPVNHIRYLVAVSYDDQPVGSWPLSHGLPIARPNNTFGSADIPAKRYNDKS
jgi:hypothetical protein